MAAVVLAVVFSLNFIFAVAAIRQSINVTKESELANVAKVVTSSLQDRELIASGSAEIISDQPWVARDMRAGDRSALLKASQPMFERMRSAYGASVLQFFTPPAEAILFVEHPDMPLTDFRATRAMVIAATVHGTSQRGLELGPVGLGVRGIAPVKDKDGLIGVVEYASDYQALLKEISILTGTQLATLVDDDRWNKARQSDKEFIPARDQVIDGRRAVYSTDWDLTSAAVTPDILAPTRGNRTTYRTINGTEYGVLTMPLMDFSGEQIGFVISVRDFAKLRASFVDGVRLAAIRMLLGFFVSFGAVVILFNSLLMRPIADLQRRLRDLVEGRTDVPLGMPWRTDEVGAIFETAEQLRQKLRAQPAVTSRHRDAHV
jgi:hypothetical protein